MSDAETVAGRKPIEGRDEIRLDKDWAREHELSRRRPACASRRRPASASAARVGPLYVPGRPEPRRLRDRGDGTRRRAADHGQAGARGTKSPCRPPPASRPKRCASASASGARARGRGGHARDQEQREPGTARLARRRPLLLLGHRAVRGHVPDPQLLQHDRAAAHARDRHAARARRRPGADRAHDPDRGSAAGARRLARSGWRSARGWRCCCCRRCRASACRSRACTTRPAPRSRPSWRASLATLIGAAWPAVRAGRVAPGAGADRRRAIRPAPRVVRRAVVGLVLFVPSMCGGRACCGSAPTPNDPARRDRRDRLDDGRCSSAWCCWPRS